MTLSTSNDSKEIRGENPDSVALLTWSNVCFLNVQLSCSLSLLLLPRASILQPLWIVINKDDPILPIDKGLGHFRASIFFDIWSDSSGGTKKTFQNVCKADAKYAKSGLIGKKGFWLRTTGIGGLGSWRTWKKQVTLSHPTEMPSGGKINPSEVVKAVVGFQWERIQ